MDNVLLFSPRANAMRRKPAIDAMPASVIIFPGIRYERAKAASGEATACAAESDPRQERQPPRH